MWKSKATGPRPIPPLRTPQHQADRILAVGRIAVIAMSVLLALLLGRVVQLQLIPSKPIAQRVAARGAEQSITARRGMIADRKGRPLAVSHIGYRLFADPMLINDPETFALQVAQAIGDNPARIDQLIGERPESRYVVISQLLTDQQAAAVRQLDLPGLALDPRLVREYPQRSTAGQVIGWVGYDHDGKEGIEFALEGELSGEPGRLHTLRDARRRPMWVERAGYAPPTDGQSVQLSIDAIVQEVAEEELARACEHHQAKRGEIVVMHARTGQLLAMANWPPFDPNDLRHAFPEIRRNRCITDPYEPGSVFKPLIFAAALAHGAAKANELIDTTTSGVWVTPFGRTLHDAHPHGLVSFDEVLVRSSNIGMGIVGERLGAQRQYEAITAFGIGRKTGVGLPGESPGIITPRRKWTKYSVTSVPMGQEVSTTPLQLVKAFSAFANDGLMVAPSLLADEASTPIFQRAVPAWAANHTRMVLRRAVSEGTGTRADSPMYRIWGKTGTAQVARADGRGYRHRVYTASFVCGAPLRDPHVIVAVVIHEPNPNIAYYGGLVSAPVAKNVIERTLVYLGVPADGDGEKKSTRQVAAGD